MVTTRSLRAQKRTAAKALASSGMTFRASQCLTRPYIQRCNEGCVSDAQEKLATGVMGGQSCWTYINVRLYERTTGATRLTAMVRLSFLCGRAGNRWARNDLDIVQIAAAKGAKRKGYATIFLSDLAQVGNRCGRGVFVEQVITLDSQAWCTRCVEQGAMHRRPGDDYGFGVEKGDEHDAIERLAQAKRADVGPYAYEFT